MTARRIEWPAALAAVLIGLAVGGFGTLRAGWIAGAIAGAIVAIAIYLWSTRRSRRRAQLARTPLSGSMRELLEEKIELYRRMPDEEKARFEKEVKFFLDEQIVTGPRGAALPERLRILVAASAVIIVFGRRGFRYPKLRDVVVYDEAFDDEYEQGHDKNILGMVHGQGPILFSARALEHGFANTKDGLNVGLHEFAHVLDFETGAVDGVPSFMPWKNVKPWLHVMHDEVKRVETRGSILRQYAATNEAEFFAVATEAFFERPKVLRQKHPELYELLKETFGQDPAGAVVSS
ncbi:MAG: zinc-dependent peptidase [Myxococcota bacterium]|nr:zinc-dependent peptidase [Myxococcota bacterium]